MARRPPPLGLYGRAKDEAHRSGGFSSPQTLLDFLHVLVWRDGLEIRVSDAPGGAVRIYTML